MFAMPEEKKRGIAIPRDLDETKRIFMATIEDEFNPLNTFLQLNTFTICEDNIDEWHGLFAALNNKIMFAVCEIYPAAPKIPLVDSSIGEHISSIINAAKYIMETFLGTANYHILRKANLNLIHRILDLQIETLMACDLVAEEGSSLLFLPQFDRPFI